MWADGGWCSVAPFELLSAGVLDHHFDRSKIVQTWADAGGCPKRRDAHMWLPMWVDGGMFRCSFLGGFNLNMTFQIKVLKDQCRGAHTCLSMWADGGRCSVARF